MDVHQNKVPQDTEKLKDIPKWTRKYAQNRTLSIFVCMTIGILFSMVIVGLASFLAAAFQKGKIVASIGAVVLIAVFLFLYKFSVAKNRLLRWTDQRIYGNEGTASIPEQKSSKKKKWIELAALIVVFCLFFGTIFLGIENYIPVKYVQPITALYYVPFAVFSRYFWRRPKAGPIYLLSPILYASQAILIVAGVPIFFTGKFGVIYNMSLPLAVYDFLTQIIGHIYGRYALKKLKNITHLEEGQADEV